MNVNLELLKVFYVVAKNENITKASEELFTTQPAISKSIKNLESQLNVNLFIRNKKGVKLTKEGEILFNHTKKILDELNDTFDIIKKTSQLNILIGRVLVEKIIYQYIALFKEEYPDTKLNISTTSIKGIQENLREQKEDLAIGYYIDDLPNKYVQEKIAQKVHPIFVCNKNYKELIDKKIDIKELEKYPFIMSAEGSTTSKLTLEIFRKNNLNISPIMTVLGTTLVTKLVKDGMGISILTKEFIKEELDNKELFEIKLNQELEPRTLVVQYYKNANLKKEAEYFISLLKNNKH